MVKRHRATDQTPDLFTATAPAALRPEPKAAAETAVARRRYLLPSDLPGALTHLVDTELAALAKAVTGELHRRGLQVPVEPSKPLSRPTAPPKDGAETRVAAKAAKSETPALTQSRINAIRAAFKAGVKPTMIARQFGVSQAIIRHALADRKG